MVALEQRQVAHDSRAEGPFFGTDQIAHQTAHAGQKVDRRVLPLIGQLSGQHDMAIQDCSQAIGNGFIEIIALNQNGEQPRYGPT